MSPHDIERVLGRVDIAEPPAVARFDAPEAIEGALVVLPSAFNPPTVAHLELLRLGAVTVGATTQAALLSTRNVDKGLYGAPLHHRIGMLLAVATDGGGPAVLATNAARFVDQAAALRRAYPAAVIDFVAGLDTLIRVFDPKYYEQMESDLEDFFAHHRLVATNRGAAGIDEVERFLADEPAARPHRERIIVAELYEAAAAVSSTRARGAVVAGIADDLPGAVARYIAEHGLYRQG